MEMTVSQAIEMLRGLIPEEDVVIDDGADYWDIWNLTEAIRVWDDGEILDLEVNEDGIYRVLNDGIVESIPMYRVQRKPTHGVE